MKLACAIATAIAAIHQAAAECDFGSNYTLSFTSSGYCDFEIGYGQIELSSESETVPSASGDANVTTTRSRSQSAVWKVGNKDSTVQCFPDHMSEFIKTEYPNGTTNPLIASGDFFEFLLSNYSVAADENQISAPGIFHFSGGYSESIGYANGLWNFTKAEGDITDMCAILGGAAPAPAPSSGRMAAATIIPCIVASVLNYFMFL